MPTDYAAELVRRSSPAYIAMASQRAQTLLEKYRPWIDKYRGGMPAGWAAAIMYWESDGNFNAPGDQSIGEVGYYQVAAYIPPIFGLPAVARMDPETNVFLGLMEYQYEVARWKVAFPNLVRLASDDAWKLARLTFSIGGGGAMGLAKLAAPSAQPGELYTAIANYVRTHGGVAAGTQSADKVAFRVLSIESQWEVGRQAGGFWATSGAPTFVPSPPAGRYSIPKPYGDLFVEPTNWFAIGTIAAASFILWRLTQ